MLWVQFVYVHVSVNYFMAFANLISTSCTEWKDLKSVEKQRVNVFSFSASASAESCWALCSSPRIWRKTYQPLFRISCLLIISPLLPLHLWTVQETEEESFSGPCSAVSRGPSLLIHVGVGVLGSLLAARLGNNPVEKTRDSSISLSPPGTPTCTSQHAQQWGWD